MAALTACGPTSTSAPARRALCTGLSQSSALRVYLLHYGSGVLAIELDDAIPGGSDITDWYSAADRVISTFDFSTS